MSSIKQFFPSTMVFGLRDKSDLFLLGLEKMGRESRKRESELLLYQTKVKCHQVITPWN